jgi:hypothetical protein
MAARVCVRHTKDACRRRSSVVALERNSRFYCTVLRTTVRTHGGRRVPWRSSISRGILGAALSALTQHRDSRGCFQSHLPSHQESHPRSHPPLTPVVRLCSSTREAPNNVHALPIPLLMAHPNEASSSRRCQLAKSLLRACDTSAIVPDRCARADPFQNPMKMASAISTKYCTRLVDQGKRRGPAP